MSSLMCALNLGSDAALEREAHQKALGKMPVRHGRLRHAYASLAQSAPSRKHYEWLRDLEAIFVDNFHARNRDIDDLLCLNNCRPEIFPNVATNTNSEACEQLFRWCALSCSAPAPSAPAPSAQAGQDKK